MHLHVFHGLMLLVSDLSWTINLNLFNWCDESAVKMLFIWGKKMLWYWSLYKETDCTNVVTPWFAPICQLTSVGDLGKLIQEVRREQLRLWLCVPGQVWHSGISFLIVYWKYVLKKNKTLLVYLFSFQNSNFNFFVCLFK